LSIAHTPIAVLLVVVVAGLALAPAAGTTGTEADAGL
jgi:hypothetical protein